MGLWACFTRETDRLMHCTLSSPFGLTTFEGYLQSEMQ